MINLGSKYPFRFRFHTIKNHWLNCIRYKIPPKPYNTINIQPREINQILSYYGDNNHEKKLKPVHTNGLGQIKSGNWDKPKHRESIHNNHIIQGMIERFEHDTDWKKTMYYNKKYSILEEEKIHKDRGFDSVEDYLRSDCAKYDRLYDKIKNKGYQANHQGTCRQPGKTQPVRDQLEILVTIDREGNIYFFDGFHRFGIAWALDLEIPVHVACRHKQWQEIRDNNYINYPSSGEGDEIIYNHPDLQDIQTHSS